MRLLKTDNMELELQEFFDHGIPDTPHSRIDGNKMSCHIRIFRLSGTETAQVSQKYKRAAKKLRQTATNGCGLILAASINRAALSFPTQSIPCLGGTRMLKYAMLIYQMYQLVVQQTATTRDNLRSVEVNGSLEAGLFRN